MDLHMPRLTPPVALLSNGRSRSFADDGADADRCAADVGSPQSPRSAWFFVVLRQTGPGLIA
jgi:hypothetical protein